MICVHNLTMKPTWDDIRKLAADQGVVTPADVRKLGLAPENLNRMVSRGILRHVGRGLYEDMSLSPSENHSYVEAAKSTPRAVVCLLSALNVHQIGTQMPWQVWIAIPRGDRVPRTRQSARVVTMSGLNYELGIEEHVFEGVPTKVYSLEKTLVDCFRLRRLVGHDVPIEALRESIQARRVDLNIFMSIADQLRAKRLIQPYLEAML